MNISFAIVNHPDRKAEALDLYQELGAEGDEVVIAYDMYLEGAEANHIRALQAAPADTDWHVVIEDDAVLSSQFHAHLREALERHPDHIVSLYMGREFPRHRQPDFEVAALRGEDFVTHYVAHGVANAYPADVAAELAGWIAPGSLPVDEQISAYAMFFEVPVVYLVPSIVDHRDEGSVIPATDWQPRTPGRKAHRFLL